MAIKDLPTPGGPCSIMFFLLLSFLIILLSVSVGRNKSSLALLKLYVVISFWLLFNLLILFFCLLNYYIYQLLHSVQILESYNQLHYWFGKQSEIMKCHISLQVYYGIP